MFLPNPILSTRRQKIAAGLPGNGIPRIKEEGNSIKRFDESMPFFATTQRNSMSTGVEDCASLGEDSGAEEDDK